jgi:signal transduction histidine kinase
MIRTRVFGAPADPDRLHRLVIGNSTVVAVSAVACFGVAWLVTGDSAYLAHMIGPATAGTFFAIQLALGRPNAFSAMVVGAVSVIGAFAYAGRPDTAVGSSIALVYIGMVGSAFVKRRVVPYIVGGSIVLFATPFFWRHNLGDADALTTAIIMAASFGVGVATVSMVMKNAARSDDRFRDLFDSAPVGLIEQDWSDALRLLERRLPPGVDVRQMLVETPVLVDEVVSRVISLRANRTAGAIMGVDSSRLIGTVSNARLSPESRSGWIEQIVALHAGNTSARFEISMHTFARKPIVLEGEILVSEAGRSVLLAFKDVTEARLASKSLEELVRAKDRFIATISHELRTPLTAVLGFTEELRSGRVQSDAERTELLALVANQSAEVAHLVEDLLVGARADIGTVTVQPEPIDVAEVVHLVIGQVDIPIGFEPPEPPISAHADPLRVRQILRNLMSNSIRYGGATRRVVIDTLPGAVVIEVRDSGPALSPADRARVFQPYERAHERPGITASVGLGLAVSRQLAGLMDGDLVYAHDGEAVFRLTIPAGPAATHLAAHPDVELESHPKEPARVA